MKTRRKFSREFKLEAVKMVKERGVAARQVSRDLDINENMLRRWIKELSEDPHEAFPGLGNMKTEQAEIARLQREVAKLKVERDILKKAALSSTGRCNTNLIECCYRRSSIWCKEVDRDFPQSRKKTCGSDGKMVNL